MWYVFYEGRTFCAACGLSKKILGNFSVKCVSEVRTDTGDVSLEFCIRMSAAKWLMCFSLAKAFDVRQGLKPS